MTYVGVSVIILTPIYFFFVAVFPKDIQYMYLYRDSIMYLFTGLHIIRCYWPLACLSWDSARNCRILSEGMAKEIPAVTFSVLIPITSPSCKNSRNISATSHKHAAHLQRTDVFMSQSDTDRNKCMFTVTADSTQNAPAKTCFKAHTAHKNTML